MKCPMCGEEVEFYFEIDIDEPFMAYNPMEGLKVWGPYSVEKDVICYQEGGAFIHFCFAGGEDRLVKMTEVRVEDGLESYLKEDEKFGIARRVVDGGEGEG